MSRNSISFYVASILTIHGVASLRQHAQGPLLVQQPPPLLHFSNSTGAVLSCVAQGSPPPRISWLDAASNEVSHIPHIREQLANGSLHFPPFAAELFDPRVHAAGYVCRASNAAGAVLSTEARVQAVVWQAFEAQVDSVVVVKGNVAVLHCRAAGLARDWLQVAGWEREEGPHGRTALHAGGRYWVTQQGDLHVRDTAPGDSYGRYYCWAVDKLTGARRLSAPGQIFVSESEEDMAPVIEHITSSLHVKVGNTAELVCVGKGNPPPAYRWYREVSGMLRDVQPAAPTVLHLARAQAGDAGRYLCSASSALGEDRREAVLRVTSPLSVQVRPQRLVADWGSPAMFSCAVTGAAPRVAWLRDGRRLAEGDLALTLRAVGREDQGMYQCVARDGEESVQASAQLVLGAMAPKLLSTFSEQTMRPGPSVSLSCLASGDPPPQVFWLLDGAPLPPLGYVVGSFVHASGDVVAHLNMSSVRVLHGGMYTCLARNHVGAASHSAALNIYGPPTARAPLNMTVAAGADVLLHCPVAGFPVSRVTWGRGQDQPGAAGGGALVLRRAEAGRDGGEYRCSVTGPQGHSAQGLVRLSIMNPPRIAPFQFAPNLEKGMRALLSCSIMSGDLPISIAWRKDGAPLPQDHGLQEKREEFASTLVFRDLDARHSGHYTCTASNAAASANYTASLSIRVPPSWLEEPQDASVLYQQSASLHCRAGGFPPPTVTWLRGPGDRPGEQTRLQPDHGTVLLGNGTVMLRAVDSAHEGHYTCRADNGIGAGLAKTVFLRVNVPAHFRTRELNQSGVLGQPAVLVCEAEGDLPLRVSWSSSRRSLAGQPAERHSPRGVTAELRVPRLARHHAGDYRCSVANNFGHDQMVVHLSVKEPPEAPRLVHLSEVGSRWLSLAWAPRDPARPPVLRYVAQHRPGEGGPWTNLTVDGTVRAARVGGLQPATTYSVRLLAVNEVGESPPSDTVAAATLQEPPSGSPIEVYAKATSSKSIIVQWKPPPAARSQVLGYVVSCREVATDKTRTRTLRGGRRLEAVLGHLRQFARYEVTVRAFNQVGAGPASPPLLVTTLEGVPDGPPRELQCVALSSTSLRARWEPPPAEHRHGVVEAYKVFYRRAEPALAEHTVKVEVKRTTNLETMLHGLSKFTSYSLRVAAITGAGEGERSPAITCLTEDDVPGPPELIKALAMTSDSVLVSWNAPAEPNGNIVKYYVYSVESGSQSVQQESVPGSGELLYEARQLKELHRYEFWVTAVTVAGEGPSSARVSQTPTSRGKGVSSVCVVPARIASFPQRLWVGAGRGARLPCHAVGLPTPGRAWRGPGGAGVSAPHEAVSGRALALGPLHPEDAGNYSCSVENVFGRDEVSHVVAVVVPPGAPALSVVASSHDSLSVTWRDSGNGGGLITGYTLRYRRESQDWQMQVVDPDYSLFPVRGLKCGCSYQLSLTAANAVGPGKPSAIVMASTKGSPPATPAEEEVLEVNATAAVLYLEAWPDGGCPLLRWESEHRAWAGGGWARLPPPRGDPGQTVVLAGLAPGTWYVLRVTVHNDAGSCRHQFVFATRTRAGEVLAPHTIPAVTEPESAADTHLGLIVPVVSGAVCTVALCVCACLLVHKRTETCYTQSQPASETKSLAELQNQRNSKQLGEGGCTPEQMYLPSPLRKNFHKDGSNTGQDYEIGPYEMFSMPGKVPGSPGAQTMDYCVQFQTFSQQECAAGCHGHHGHGPRGGSRSRAGRAARSSDSLEISCISSQQTLQLGARSAGRADASDSDSSGPDQHSLPPVSASRTPRREGHCDRDSTLRDAPPRQHHGRHLSRLDNTLERLSDI